MDKNGTNLALVIQEFLDLKARQDNPTLEACDKCLYAFEVTIVHRWVDLPRIVALIRNEQINQTVIFIFAGTRITDTVVGYLTADKLIAVDDELSYPSKPTMLRIIGRDISSSKSDTIVLGTNLPHRVRISSDFQKYRSMTLTSGIPIITAMNRFCTINIEFDDATSANQFRTELAFEPSFQFDSTVLSATNTNWLNKYRADIAQKTSPSTVPKSFSNYNRTLRAAKSTADLAHDEMPNVSSPLSSSNSCSSTSSESLYDIEEGQGYATFENEVPRHVRRAASVPKLSEEEEENDKVEKGKDIVSELTSGNSSADDLTTPQPFNDGVGPTPTTAASEQKLVDFKESPTLHPVQAIRSEASCKRSKTVNFMPDLVFRARINADPIVRSKLEEDEAAYCSWKTLNLFIGSWNVNGRQDALLNLDAWISSPSGHPPADIYVFGFQELDLNLAGMALNKQTASPFESKWLWLLETSMKGLLCSATPRQWIKRAGGGFTLLSTVRLAGLLLVVYVSNRLHQNAVISNIALQAVPTGMFNLMGNKGAVGIRLTVYNHSLCFLNCHLAAGSGNRERRNQDYGEIVRKMVFELHSPLEPVQYLRIDDHDQVFLFGDLNYRIVGLDIDKSLTAIFKKDFPQLLQFDELLIQRAHERVLQGFFEGKITFPPTYKFDLLTNSYYIADGRMPSYCDRILWKGKFVRQLVYRSHEAFRLSDHKPVSSYFKIGARCVNQQLFMCAYEAVMRSQDLFYNMLLPQASLSTQEVDFGLVRFEDIRTETIRLTNTGHSLLEFAFTQEGAAAFPPWLHVAPPNARVEKGESCDISLDVCVSPDVVAAVQSSTGPLSCIIVLTLVGGKDFFISIDGSLVPTSFGLPLTLLLRLPTTPVALLPSERLSQMIRESRLGNWSGGEPSVVTSSSGPIFSIPKEIYRLTDFIAERFEEPGLFRRPEMRSDLPTIRDTLDTTKHDIPIPSSVSVHSVIYSLLVFLSALPEPVVPFAFQSNCIAAARHSGADDILSAYQAISRLPIDYQNLFFYLVSFIKRCLCHSDKNGTNVDMLASTFADILMRDPPYAASPPTGPYPGYNSTKTTNFQQQSSVLNRQDLKTVFLRIFITSDTEQGLGCGAHHRLWEASSGRAVLVGMESVIVVDAHLSITEPTAYWHSYTGYHIMSEGKDPKRIHRQFIVQDSPEEDISRFFFDAVDFIHGGRVNHGNVLIHCACGISRSVSLTLAYLLCVTDFQLRDLYKGMRAARLGASPNYGFLRQLQRFEESGEHLKARRFLEAKYGPWPAEKAALDRTAMEAHIAAQEAFIQTGYYPWDERAPSAPATGGQASSARFVCRLPDNASTLEDALASAPPPDQ